MTATTNTVRRSPEFRRDLQDRDQKISEAQSQLHRIIHLYPTDEMILAFGKPEFDSVRSRCGRSTIAGDPWFRLQEVIGPLGRIPPGAIPCYECAVMFGYEV